MQLNLYSDPCIQPVPLTYPLVMEGGSSGHSNGKKNITYYRISNKASVWEKKTNNEVTRLALDLILLC